MWILGLKFGCSFQLIKCFLSIRFVLIKILTMLLNFLLSHCTQCPNSSVQVSPPILECKCTPRISTGVVRHILHRDERTSYPHSHQSWLRDRAKTECRVHLRLRSSNVFELPVACKRWHPSFLCGLYTAACEITNLQWISVHVMKDPNVLRLYNRASPARPCNVPEKTYTSMSSKSHLVWCLSEGQWSKSPETTRKWHRLPIQF